MVEIIRSCIDSQTGRHHALIVSVAENELACADDIMRESALAETLCTLNDRLGNAVAETKMFIFDGAVRNRLGVDRMNDLSALAFQKGDVLGNRISERLLRFVIDEDGNVCG